MTEHFSETGDGRDLRIVAIPTEQPSDRGGLGISQAGELGLRQACPSAGFIEFSKKIGHGESPIRRPTV